MTISHIFSLLKKQIFLRVKRLIRVFNLNNLKHYLLSIGWQCLADSVQITGDRFHRHKG